MKTAEQYAQRLLNRIMRSSKIRGLIDQAIGGGGPLVRHPGPDLLSVTQPAAASAIVLHYTPGDPPATVGAYTSLNDRSYLLLGGEHHTEWISTFEFDGALDGVWRDDDRLFRGPIVIGSDVLTSFESLIISGVNVGHGAVVAARAVVTKDVPPYAIVAGVPAKVIGWRFDQATREALLRIAWWEWSPEKVTAHRPQLGSDDLKGFLASHDPTGPRDPCAACSPMS